MQFNLFINQSKKKLHFQQTALKKMLALSNNSGTISYSAVGHKIIFCSLPINHFKNGESAP